MAARIILFYAEENKYRNICRGSRNGCSLSNFFFTKRMLITLYIWLNTEVITINYDIYNEKCNIYNEKNIIYVM